MMSSEKAETFADGIRVKAPAGFGFKVLQEGLSGFITVSDSAIAEALRTYLVLTGSNIDRATLAAVLADA